MKGFGGMGANMQQATSAIKKGGNPVRSKGNAKIQPRAPMGGHKHLGKGKK